MTEITVSQALGVLLRALVRRPLRKLAYCCAFATLLHATAFVIKLPLDYQLPIWLWAAGMAACVWRWIALGRAHSADPGRHG